MRQQGGVIPGQESAEGSDRRQPRIAGFATASPDGLQVIQERQHQRFVEILDTQFLDALLARVRRIAEQQSERIAVSQDGVGGQAFLDRQVVAEKPFHGVRQVGAHRVSPGDLTCCK